MFIVTNIVKVYNLLQCLIVVMDWKNYFYHHIEITKLGENNIVDSLWLEEPK